MKSITFKQTVNMMITTLILMICISCDQSTKQKKGNIQLEETAEICLENKEVKANIETTNELEFRVSNVNLDAVHTPSKANKPFNLPHIVDDFIICKSNATERSDCRNEITKVISDIYGLSEFKNSKNEYVIYDSIQPIIKKSNQWKNIGTANNQKVLDTALEHTNNGGLTLIIDTSESYGHVVAVIPGKAKKSGSWGLNLPPVLSLLNYKPELSFHDKSLSYAMKKSDALQVFIRE